jgi:hypothetical protein
MDGGKKTCPPYLLRAMSSSAIEVKAKDLYTFAAYLAHKLTIGHLIGAIVDIVRQSEYDFTSLSNPQNGISTCESRLLE